jgi:hypothetical protein
MSADPLGPAEPLAAAIVEALLADDWADAVRLISATLGDSEELTGQLAADLRTARAEMLSVPVAERGRARLAVRDQWRARISRLLTGYPGATPVVLDLMARLQSQRTGFAGYPGVTRSAPPGTSIGDSDDDEAGRDEAPPGTSFGDDWD